MISIHGFAGCDFISGPCNKYQTRHTLKKVPKTNNINGNFFFSQKIEELPQQTTGEQVQQFAASREQQQQQQQLAAREQQLTREQQLAAREQQLTREQQLAAHERARQDVEALQQQQLQQILAAQRQQQPQRAAAKSFG
jgi:hypothetical protein